MAGRYGQAAAGAALIHFRRRPARPDEIIRLRGIPAIQVNAMLHEVEADAALQKVCDIRPASVGRRDPKFRPLGQNALAVGNGKQIPAVKGRVGKTDERFVTAAVMPGQQGGRQIGRRLREKAVRVEVHFDALALFLDHVF